MCVLAEGKLIIIPFVIALMWYFHAFNEFSRGGGSWALGFFSVGGVGLVLCSSFLVIFPGWPFFISC